MIIQYQVAFFDSTILTKPILKSVFAVLDYNPDDLQLAVP